MLSRDLLDFEWPPVLLPALETNHAVRDLEEFAAAQREGAARWGVSGKLAADGTAETPLNDNPLAVL